MKFPLFVSLPHSCEFIPSEAIWLKGRTEEVLLRDVDRFVDALYELTIKKLGIPSVHATAHRYAIDLNRAPDNYDATVVQGGPEPSDKKALLYWKATTVGEPLMAEPISHDVHWMLLKKYHTPFYQRVQELLDAGKILFPEMYHLDLHSMPSVGKAFHRDEGRRRKDIVISDNQGKSAQTHFVELVMESFKKAGFDVAYNDPYLGGGITKHFGQPSKRQNTVQVELNRALYMDELSFQKKEPQFQELQKALGNAISQIITGIEAKTKVKTKELEA